MNIEQTYTYNEIMQQPQMWLEEYGRILADRERISSFVKAHQDYEIILTGAGTSAFIGDSASVALQARGLRGCRAVPTTDIITHPEAHLAGRKVMLISFARSGNSPESIGAVRLANRLCDSVAHVFITCNADGNLARMADECQALPLLLPPQTDDRSLAMTSSFSTMYAACLLMFDTDRLAEAGAMIKAAADNARHILDNCRPALRQIAESRFDRAVFLGSGPLRGIAEECHLKLQELTDGAVICKFDSFLGFRHGPKAVVKPDALLVYLMSDDEKVQRYERDLVAQINANNRPAAQVIVTQGARVSTDGPEPALQIVMPHPSRATGAYGLIPYVLAGQLLGLYKSAGMGLNPDSPSVSGNISRVVEGVSIYE